MKISAAGKETTVIEFSKEELEGCCLTYENISRNESKSKTAIFTIINETAKISGNNKIIDENTRIDILPDGEGGCVIILNNQKIKRDEPESVVLFSESLNCFFDLARSARHLEAYRSGLYATDTGYALYIEGETRLLRLCVEFSDVRHCDSTGLCYLDEYCRPLVEKNALEILGGRASEK